VLLVVTSTTMLYSPTLKAKPVVFGTLCVALLASKATLLRVHASTVSSSAMLLYLPTLVLSDFAVICVARASLPRRTNRLSTFGFVVNVALT
jgi:hypothetical protein